MASNVQCMLGVDIGGTSVKALICDETGHTLSFFRNSTAPAYRGSDTEIDVNWQRTMSADTLWYLTAQTIREAVKRLPENCTVFSAAVSACGCTMFLLDEMGRQINWSCPEDAWEEELTAYRIKYTAENFCAVTGYMLNPGLSGLYLSAFGRLVGGERLARIVSVDDYILYRLTGEWVRNYSTACSCGMWNHIQDEWLSFFQNRSGLDGDVLGKPVESGTRVGRITQTASEETGLAREVWVSTGGHDYECAALACASLLREGGVLQVTGTVDLVATFFQGVPQKRLDTVPRTFDRHVRPGYMSEMLEAPGTVQLEWLCSRILQGTEMERNKLYAGLEQRLKEQPIGRALMLPTLCGGRMSGLGENTGTMFWGLDAKSDSIDLLRASVLGLCLQEKWMLEQLQNTTVCSCPGQEDWGEQTGPTSAVYPRRTMDGKTLKSAFTLGKMVDGSCNNRLMERADPCTGTIVATGGASQNSSWMQLRADVFGRDLTVPELPEASALGAALLAGVGSGIYTSHSQAANAVGEMKQRKYKPDAGRNGVYREIYKHIFWPLVQFGMQLDQRWKTIDRE